jgi:HlyD family secretion protein
VAVLSVLGVAAYFVFDRVAEVPEGSLRVSGNIEVTQAEVSFKIPGKLAERLVDEGETVQAGQVAARLESSDLSHEVAARQADAAAAEAVLAELEAGARPQEIAQAEAAARAAQARLDEMLAGSRPEEIAAAQAALDQAQAETVRAQADFNRYSALHEKAEISDQQFVAVRTALATAQARQEEARQRFEIVQQGPRKEQIEQARAAAREAAERAALIKAGARKEQIAQARARRDQVRQALALAETRLGYAILAAPFSGIVLSKNAEPGEFLAAGTPVITIAELGRVWLRAYINETDLARVKPGQAAKITTDTYPDKSYGGRVSFISSEAEFTPKTVQTEQERVKLVYRIKIDVPNPQMELKPGMPADAAIDLTANPASLARSESAPQP